ncbi:MAG: GTP-binding protein, partial [Victivallaceae bacterium]|nr:GTP-binding protein [Victivallaceae bacterium]
GRHFQLVDTGGLGMPAGKTRNVDTWDKCIADQVEAAIGAADILILVGNVQEGVVPLDEEVARRLRTCGTRVILAANKSDNPELSAAAAEFSALGFEEIIPVSSLHRQNIDLLLDQVVKDFVELAIAEEEHEPFRIAVV